jgi:hypothetical protein
MHTQLTQMFGIEHPIRRMTSEAEELLGRAQGQRQTGA